MAGIGIFGGTFDPIHLGHLRTVYEVTQRLSLETVYFVPNAQTVHRHQPHTPFAHRLAMVEQAIAGVDAWQVSDCEARRSGASYSYHTIQAFRQSLGEEVEIWLLLGSDAFRQFHTWHRWQEILTLCHLAVMTRAGEAVIGGCEETTNLLLHQQDDAAVGRILPISVSALDISSSQIRSLFKQGQQPHFLLPNALLTYIDQHQLYSNQVNDQING